jgi:predicted permease
MSLLQEFFRDLRYGARLLRRNTIFTATAVLSLALGIGGATAVFTLVNAVVLRTLPVPRPSELYAAKSIGTYGSDNLYSVPTLVHAQDELRSTGAQLAAATDLAGMELQSSADASPSRGQAQLVSGDYFDVLEQRPEFGRLLTRADNASVGESPVAVVSDAYWRRHFGSSTDLTRRTVTVNGTLFSIVGVTRPKFFGTTVSLHAADVWIPFMMQPVVRYEGDSSAHNADRQKPWPSQVGLAWLNLFVRVPSSTPVTQVEAALTGVEQRDEIAQMSKRATDDDRAAIRKSHVQMLNASAGISSLRDDVSTPLFVLLAMVGVLLVIACGNVAGLLVSRAAGREREVAIRVSIGAARGRLVRQFLAESLLLAGAGGVLGMTFAIWARDALLALLVNTNGSIDLDTTLDGRVLAFSVAVTAVTGVASGILPALRGTRVAAAESLKQQSRAVGGEAGRRGLFVGRSLVVAQMAFCLLLLVVAGLFGRSLRALARTDVGFDRNHVLTATLDYRAAGYSPQERLVSYRRIVDRLQALPGVAAASLSENGPLADSARISSLNVDGYVAGKDEHLRTNEEIVTDRYFDAVGLRMLAGRGFESQDRDPAAHSTIVNETFAKRFFPKGDPVGRHWTYGGPIDKDAFVIVGVVEDARYVDLKVPPPNMVYHVAESRPAEVLDDLEIRTSGAPAAIVASVRQAIAESAPRLPLVRVTPLSERIANGLREDRMVSRLTTVFGALALMLASLGLYGTISYGVSRRMAELALRIALGADRRSVQWLVLRQALALVCAGGAVGLPLAFIAARTVSSLLYNIPAADPLAFSIGFAVLLAVSTLAAYLPAYRASRIEPMAALNR